MDKKGLGILSFALIIIGIAAVVTILVIVFYEPKNKEVVVPVTPEALDFSRNKGCDVDNGQIWCGITQTCYNVKTEKCEMTTITDGYGCKVNEGEKWCNEGGKCIKPGEACTPKPYVPPVTPPPVVTPPVVTNTTPNINMSNTTNTNINMIPPVQNLTPPVNLTQPINVYNDTLFNPNMTGGNNS